MPIGDTTPTPVMTTLRGFGTEWLSDIGERRRETMGPLGGCGSIGPHCSTHAVTRPSFIASRTPTFKRLRCSSSLLCAEVQALACHTGRPSAPSTRRCAWFIGCGGRRFPTATRPLLRVETEPSALR
jgi:hypothetical protein